ncbi:hypothetical protein FPRO04_13459 [Fusarium proliferatum]|nr:hypothetical protein FPRO04_13459 [Fusarium proliferatum]
MHPNARRTLSNVAETTSRHSNAPRRLPKSQRAQASLIGKANTRTQKADVASRNSNDHPLLVGNLPPSRSTSPLPSTRPSSPTRASAAATIAEAFCMQDERARDKEATTKSLPRQAMRRPQEVGFYDPDRPVMIANRKATTYFCIYALTDRLRHSVDLKGIDAVKEVWIQCLQGQAMIWLSQVFWASHMTTKSYSSA